jgi:hypothetical protein
MARDSYRFTARDIAELAYSLLEFAGLDCRHIATQTQVRNIAIIRILRKVTPPASAG